MIRVVIADDHPVVRAGVRALLDAEADIEVVGEAATADEAVALAASLAPELVLMDLQFGERAAGAEATRRVRALAAPPYVLVLTNYDTDGDILGAVEAGASGYCSRTPRRTSSSPASVPLRPGRALWPRRSRGASSPVCASRG